MCQLLSNESLYLVLESLLVITAFRLRAQSQKSASLCCKLLGCRSATCHAQDADGFHDDTIAARADGELKRGYIIGFWDQAELDAARAEGRSGN